MPENTRPGSYNFNNSAANNPVEPINYTGSYQPSPSNPQTGAGNFYPNQNNQPVVGPNSDVQYANNSNPNLNNNLNNNYPPQDLNGQNYNPSYQDPNYGSNGQNYDPNYDPNYNQNNPNPSYNSGYNPGYQDPNYQYYDQQNEQGGFDNGYFQAATGPMEQEPPLDTNRPPRNGKKFELIPFLLKFWWLVLLVLLGISLFGIGIYSIVIANSKPTAPIGTFTGVTGNIEAPPSLAKGTPETWKITIENKENTALSQVEIKLNFDPNFEFIRAISPSPDRPQGDLYKIPRLEAPGSGVSQLVIQIQGTSKGNIDEEIAMKGEVSYTPEALINLQKQGKLGANTSLRRSVPIQTSTTRTTAATVRVEVVSSESTVQNGGEVELTINLRNTSEKEIRDLRLRASYPDQGAFTYLSSQLSINNLSTPKSQPDQGNNIWEVPNLGRLQQQTLKIRGKVFGADGVKVNFSAEVLLKNGDNYQTIATGSRDVIVASQALQLSTKIEGKEQDKIFRPGESLTVVVEYENKGNSNLNNVEIFGFIDDPADILDWNNVQFVGGDRGSVNNKVIQWRGVNVNQLIKLGPTQKGQVRFSIKVKENQDFLKSYLRQNSYLLVPKAQAKAESFQQIEVAGDPYKARGGITFEQKIQALDPDPAQLNKRKYIVLWTLKTQQNQINDITVKTRSPLPPNSWVQSSILPLDSAAKLSYNPTNGEIIWTPENIPSYAGLSSPVVSISFELIVEAKGTNFNNIKLFESPQITGRDDFTGETYTSTGEAGVTR